MKPLLLCALLLWPASAWATPLTFDFAGTIAYTHGTIDGSFTYESTAAPSAVNVHNLNPNVVYTLTDWNVTVTQDYRDIPSLAQYSTPVTFSNALANNTSEFCLGKCIFSPQPLENLQFFDGENSLHLAFTIPNFTQTPPGTIGEWGPLVTAATGGASWFQSPHVIAILTEGGISGVGLSEAVVTTQSVPEPTTWILMTCGLLGVWGLRYALPSTSL